MLTNKNSTLRLALGLFLTFILIISSVQSASANVRVTDAGDLPYYARINSGELYHNSEWAVVIFYRPPECIPQDFNLLTFFDIPGAFACGPFTTDGFAVWKNGPQVDPAPIQLKLSGLGAVPVWFVPWPALQSAVADGVLSMADLASMAPLKGYASYYEETVHPSGIGHPSMIEFVARGTLVNGKTFDVHANSTDAKVEPTTRIVFK